MLDLTDFGAVNPRFLLPLAEFDIRIYYGEFYLPQTEYVLVRAILARALRSAIAEFAEITPRDITAGLLPALDEDDQNNNEVVYAFGTVSMPVYGFSVQIGRTQLRLAKFNTSLADALSAINLMQEVIKQMIPPVETPGSFVDELGLRDSLYATSYGFSHQLRMVQDLNNRARPITNIEVADKLLNLKLAHGAPRHSSPLGALQMDSYVRADASIIGYRSFENGTRQIQMRTDCPYNVSQKDVDVRTSCRSGYASAPFQTSHMYDFQTPFLKFYRDLILSQFFEDVFGNFSIEARL